MPLAAARGRAARDRGGRGGAGRGGGVDRARRPGAVPSSARALGGLPRGGPGDRQDVHRALAEATDPRRRSRSPSVAPRPRGGRSPTRRWPASWSARPTGRRAAAASRRRPRSCERATELTPDPARRGARALAAAQAKFEAGAPDAAHELLAAAELGPLDELQRARLARLRAQIVFARRRGSDAPPLLLDAAKRLEPLDDGLARETYLEALGAAIFAGRLSGRPECGRRPRPPGPRRRDRSRRGRSTCSWTAWRRGSPRATWRACRRCRRALRRVPAGRRTQRGRHHALALAGVPVAPEPSRPSCGTTRRGTSWPPARSGSLATPARSPSFRSRSPTAPACTCTPESSPRPRR